MTHSDTRQILAAGLLEGDRLTTWPQFPVGLVEQSGSTVHFTVGSMRRTVPASARLTLCGGPVPVCPWANVRKRS